MGPALFFTAFLLVREPAVSAQVYEVADSEIIRPDNGLTHGGKNARRAVVPPHVPRTLLNSLQKAWSTTNPVAPQGLLLKEGPSTLSILTRFDGISVSQSRQIPPDPQIAVGPDSVIETVNAMLRMSTKTNTKVSFQNMDEHFANSSYLFDPHVVYDPASKRYFLIAADYDDNPKISRLRLSISRSDHPSSLSGWCSYTFNTNISNTYSDFPAIGFNEKWLAITADNFRFNNGDFFKVVLKVMDKTSLVNNASRCPQLKSYGFQLPDFWVQPARSYTNTTFSGTPLFLLSSNYTDGDTYQLWRITDSAGKPLVTRATISAQPFTVPPDAAHKGPGLPYWTIGPEVQPNVTFRDDVITFALTTGCVFGDIPNETCARIVQLTPDETSAHVLAEYTFGTGPNTYLWMPAVAVSRAGNLFITFQRSTQSSFISFGVTALKKGSTNFIPFKTIRSTTCNLLDIDEGLNRTGDFTAAEIDPSDELTAWIAGEFAAQRSGKCSWSTTIARLSLR